MAQDASNVRAWLPACAALLLGLPVQAQKPDDFAHHVAPILQKHCIECHAGKEVQGGFSMNTRELFLDEGYAVPKAPEESYFLELILSDDPDLQMPPPERPRVSTAEVEVLQKWVEQGMPWDEGFTFAPPAYEPPLRPRPVELPPAQNGRHHPIDRIIDADLADHEHPRPAPIDDATFLRRVSLDLIGKLPDSDELQSFVNSTDPQKRDRMVRQLLSRDIDYADHWLTFWNDLLRNDYTGTGFITGGRKQITRWLYDALVWNKPYDQFVRELIAPPDESSTGFIDGIKWRGEVSAGQTLAIQFSQSISQSFLGINMKCASCHDSFIDRWTLEEAYGLAAIYSESELEIHRCDKPVGKVAEPKWLFPELGQIAVDIPKQQRLQQLAELMTHPENGRFARTIVNRLWAQLMGRGIVHPLDAMQTEPWNEDLLDFLANFLVEQDYNLKAVLELIATSAAYQSQTEVLTEQPTGEYQFRGPRAKRMTAEQFVDAVWQLTEAAPYAIDAPVFRAKITPEQAESIELQGRWIWRTLTYRSGRRPPAPAPPRRSSLESSKTATQSKPATQTVLPQPEEWPGGESVLLRKVLNLDSPVLRGGLAITCDNSFRLYINGREVLSGDNWNQVRAVPLHSLLKQGRNEIVVLATNTGDSPNPAGLSLEGRLRLSDGRTIVLATDETWTWNANIPRGREGRLGRVTGDWSPVKVMPTLDAWRQQTELQTKSIVAQAEFEDVPMVRAALLNNDFLMRSLGRPLRDQIVTSRPNDLTTLEAIDLSNGAQFATALTLGGEHWAQQQLDAESLARELFLASLSRQPTRSELNILSDQLSPVPTALEIEDLLWTLFMMPEFLLIR